MAYSVGGKSSSSSDTLNSTPEWKYDVFLSFAGKDTRLKFVDHLDEALKRSGIKTFRDDVDLERGGDIKKDLFQAIQDSLCAIPIISENYADSTWCLDELQKILDSQNTLGRRVFPIFYDVDPADVRHQRKRFRKALAEHEDKFIENTERVENWKNVLVEIGNLSGWDTRGQHEADLIKNIVGAVWSYLSFKLPSYDDNLVGIESKVADVMPILEFGLDDKRFVGIWGMGGVGKTTLARFVFEKLSDKFEVCCFLDKVRESLLQRKGLLSLQNKLLSGLKTEKISDANKGMKMIKKLLGHKKVLLVLDDVDDKSHLNDLAESPNWFGKGSRIIMTTRDSQLLTSFGVDKQRIYEMKTMEEDESLQLFSKKAFKKDVRKEKYLELSKSVVKYAGGLPLALGVLGSFLCGRSEAEWKDALDRLKQTPNNDILKVLKISYDVLNEEEKAIFLDIACFFKGWPKKKVTRILKSRRLHPTIGIKVLIQKTLLFETEDCKLEMHDLLQEMGRDLVQQESPNFGNRSRLWKFEDIREVLHNNKGSEATQAIVYQDSVFFVEEIEVHPEAFSKMSNIRLLITNNLPSPLKLSGALKFIDLSWSKFIETPDFSGVPYLEHLRLLDCKFLKTVDSSLGVLKRLVEVCLDGCEDLAYLPLKLETNSLTRLSLRGCLVLSSLPEFGKGMQKLSHLDVMDTYIDILPESLGSLTGLRYLNWSRSDGQWVEIFSESQETRQISGINLMTLTELYLSHCDLNDGSIPDDFGSLSSLVVLDLSYNQFVNLPIDCFASLSGLVFLSLDDCYRLKSLPGLPPRLVFLSLDDCCELKSLPGLPPRLIRLHAAGCNSMEPLSERQLWNWVASLDHEYRRRTKYVIFDEEHDDDVDMPLEFKRDNAVELLQPLRDFCAVIPKCEIPSWFLNSSTEDDVIPHLLSNGRREYEIKVEIPPHFHKSEWLGICVCIQISSDIGYSFMDDSYKLRDCITWSSKAPEDDDYIWKEWGHKHWMTFYEGAIDHLWIMVLELNEETCWQHLRGDNNFLHIKLSMYNYNYHDPIKGLWVESDTDCGKIMGCGWRVIRKEEIKEWCDLNHSNQFTQSQVTTPDEVRFPWRVLDNITGKVEQRVVQDPNANGQD